MRALVATAALLAFLAASAASADTESRILSVTIDPEDLVSGGPVSVVVATTPDVVSVEAWAGPHRVPIPCVEPGLYSGSGTVPKLPHFIRGRFRVHFSGRTTAGETVGIDKMIRLN
jgi:hypothetical protein